MDQKILETSQKESTYKRVMNKNVYIHIYIYL